jgi:hypothetical protein
MLIPTTLILKLCKTKDHTLVSEVVFIQGALNSAFWLANFARRWNTMAIICHFVGRPLE